MKYLWIFTAALLLSATPIKDEAPAPNPFFTGSLPSAKELAGAEGKLILLDFYAKWCPPCRIMDETCLRDEKIKDYLQRNFVALKVNIDDLDGNVIKQNYRVKRLPTYLVLGSDGEEIDRIEGSMSEELFLSFLQRCNKPAHRQKIPLERPALTPNDNQTAIPTTENANGIVNESPLPGDKVDPNSAEELEFIVQVGIYSSRSSARDLANRIHESTGLPTEIELTQHQGNPCYRVSAGGYSEKNLAEFASAKLVDAGWDNFIRKR